MDPGEFGVEVDKASSSSKSAKHFIARAYPGFWSQTGLGMTEFADRKLVVPPDAKLIHNLPEAKLITEYLEDYCDNHIYDGKTLRGRMIFDCDVQAINKTENVWYVTTMIHQKASHFRAAKLVMASGMYTKPNMPELPRVETFKGKVIHQKDFGRSHILDDAVVKHVVVMGGAKSAGDMAYASAKAGKAVSWLLRESGSGAGTFSEPNGIGFYKNAPEIASTRLVSLLTPSIFSPQTIISRFCHGTSWGRSLMRVIFTSTDRAALALGNFRTREGAREGFSKLESSPE
jgi:dimethylaniline monooxygenase (N-oxide forming)